MIGIEPAKYVWSPVQPYRTSEYLPAIRAYPRTRTTRTRGYVDGHPTPRATESLSCIILPANDPRHQRTPASVPPCPRSITTRRIESARRPIRPGFIEVSSSLPVVKRRPSLCTRRVCGPEKSHGKLFMSITLAALIGSSRAMPAVSITTS
jgi:hypothetical protein